MFQIIRTTTKHHLKTVPVCCYCTKKETTPARMPTELTKSTDVTSKSELEKLKDAKVDLRWRSPWHEKEGQRYSTLRTFYSEHNNTDVIKFLQSPINLTPTAIKNWWARREEKKKVMMQQYIPERNQMLGNELAAAHFIVHRGGSVKFFGQQHWIKANQFNQYELPSRYEPNLYLQGIDCTEMELFYEGLVNLKDLHQVEWLSIHGCENMDDWCMDRISNIFGRSLLYLDIRECPNITFRGLGAIAKMEKLKILYVEDNIANPEIEMTCLLLQDANPQLDIRIE